MLIADFFEELGPFSSLVCIISLRMVEHSRLHLELFLLLVFVPSGGVVHKKKNELLLNPLFPTCSLLVNDFHIPSLTLEHEDVYLTCVKL